MKHEIFVWRGFQCSIPFLMTETEQVVEKRYERRQYKAKFNEKAEFMSINEHFEANFNAVVASAIVFQQSV